MFTCGYKRKDKKDMQTELFKYLDLVKDLTSEILFLRLILFFIQLHDSMLHQNLF